MVHTRDTRTSEAAKIPSTLCFYTPNISQFLFILVDTLEPSLHSQTKKPKVLCFQDPS